MRTYVYIDGSNLYYGSLRGTTFKWLNPQELYSRLLPQHRINHIKYFTAHVSARPGDPDQPTTQRADLRALRTLPHLDIILGHFLSSNVHMSSTYPPFHGPKTAQVIKTEEKGSDVNIAAHLLSDGFQGLYETAVLITNDSDLREPVGMVREQLQLPVDIISPYKKPSRVLAQHATFITTIRTGVLTNSQVRKPLTDNGEYLS
jgi:hypothetical protein